MRTSEWDIGAAVRGYHWASPRPRGRVLLQHGYGEHSERFVTRYHELIPQLVSRGLDVYAIDMPGHGRSPGRRGSVDVREAARHHLTAKRALVADGPILLFGHSLGGLVTAHTIVEDATGVAGAVIASAALPPPPGPLLRGFALSLATVAPHARAPLRAVPPSTLARSDGNAELIAADPLSYRGRLTNLTARTALAAAADVWRGAPNWTAPTLILHGTADLSTDPRGSQRLFEAIAAPDKTLQLVDDGYHELLNDKDRDSVRDLVLDWLDRHSA